MTISLENLELIPKLLDEIRALKLNSASNEKKWLTSRELSEYMGYSLDTINKMVQEDILVDGIHYYQPAKKLIFNKHEIDNWIMGYRSDKVKRDVNAIVSEVLADIL